MLSQAPAEPAPPPPPVEGAELVPVEIVWEGIGALYKSYFSDQKAITALSVALAPYFSETVQLTISFDSEKHLGRIRILVPPGALRTPPKASPADLQALSPLLVALAVYRDDLSSRYDIRIQSFHIGLDFFRGPVHCRVSAAGEPPPDGRLVDPCVLVNGQKQCGTPGPQGVAFVGETAAQVERCLER